MDDEIINIDLTTNQEQDKEGPVEDEQIQGSATKTDQSVSPEKLKEIRRHKFIGQGHGLNPDGVKIGDGAQEYLKSLLPQI